VVLVLLPRDDAGLAAADFDAVDREDVDFAAVLREREAAGLEAAVLRARDAAAFGFAAADSSAFTRFWSSATCLRRLRMSSTSPLKRAAVCETSSRRSRAPPAPSCSARSTALRTASVVPPVLSFFAFLSFFAMAATLICPPVLGKTVHLRPHAAVAERVLAPGDPGRALRLAQQLLDTPKMLNHHRGLWGYTGAAADGEPLTIQSTGLGGPSTAIVAEELIALGARRIVRVGTCTALGDAAALGSLVVANVVVPADGASLALGAEAPLLPDPGLLAGLEGGTAGVVVSSDLFYGPEPDWEGAVAVDLSAGALLAVAARHGVAAACLLTVARAGDEYLDPEALERAEVELGRAGAAALS
jgi:uridine phosphorylase